MTEEFSAQEIHFIKTAVESVTVQGKDSILVAQVLVKISKALEAQASKEGLLPDGTKQQQPPAGSLNNPHPEGTALPEGAPPIPGTHAPTPEGTNG